MELAGTARACSSSRAHGPGIVLLHGWGDSADTWRPLLAELGALRAARDRRRPAGLRPGRRACGRARSCRSSTTSPPRSCTSGAAASTSSSPATRSAAAWRCGSASSRRAAARRRRPGGARRGWTARLVRPRRARPDRPRGCSTSRSRCPVALVRSLVGGAYRRARVLNPRAAQREVADAFSGAQRRARARGRAARLRPPPAARAGDGAVRPRRGRVPGDARVGHARPDGPAQRRARRARRPARHARGADRGLRPQPAARGDRALLELLLAFPPNL